TGEAFLQFRLAPVPLPGKRILQRPPGVQGGPIEVAYDVEDARTDGVVAAGCDELRLGRGGSQRLVRGEETGAEKGALRAKHQRGGKAAPVRDPAGCHHHDLVVALPTASTTAGTSAKVERVAPCPPASVPCATMMSVPISTASIACATVCTWEMSAAPASLIAAAKGRASPKESMTATGL